MVWYHTQQNTKPGGLRWYNTSLCKHSRVKNKSPSYKWETVLSRLVFWDSL